MISWSTDTRKRWGLLVIVQVDTECLFKGNCFSCLWVSDDRFLCLYVKAWLISACNVIYLGINKDNQ